jgi:hypothetical protein
MKPANEYTRKDLQHLACVLGMLYLNQDNTNILWDGLMYEGDDKQQLIDSLHIEATLLKAEIKAVMEAKINKT